MDDRANIAYAALPERLYVVQDGRVIYQVLLLLPKTFVVDNYVLFGYHQD